MAAPRDDVAEVFPLRFFRVTPADAPAWSSATYPHLATTSVFRFKNAYRDTVKYAVGLLRLADAVASHLPGFALRIAYDSSLDPGFLRAEAASAPSREAQAASASAAATWEVTFARLRALPHVQLVRFEAPEFLAPDDPHRVYHQDLFGTMVRFLPLFGGEAEVAHLPSWVRGPPDGRVVFVTDADFADLTTEHTYLHLVKWFAATLEAAQRGGESSGMQLPGGVDADGVSREPTPSTVPDLVTMSTAGSGAPRHTPDMGLPPFIAYCITTSTRMPMQWFTDFFVDARRQGKSFLLGRYCDDLHDPRAHNYTYKHRRIGAQKSRFPFGIDEFFLTAIFKMRCLASPVRRGWLFLTLPNVDIVLRKCISLVGDAVAKDRAMAGDPRLHRVLALAATVASDASTAAALASPPTAASLLASEDNFKKWGNTWPGVAAGRIAMFSPFPGRFLHAVPEVAAPLANGLRETFSATLDAIGAGLLPHKAEDAAVLMDNLKHLATPTGAKGVAANFWSVGGGRLYALPGGAMTEGVVAHLASVRGCAVPLPHIGVEGLNSYKPSWNEQTGDKQKEVIAASLRLAEACDAAAAGGSSAAAGSVEGSGTTAGVKRRREEDASAGVAATTAAAAASSAESTAEPESKRPREAAAAAAAPAAPTAAGEAEGPLPEGWEKKVSGSTGKVYYHFVKTGHTQWTRPTA